jgi:hypothetical protein
VALPAEKVRDPVLLFRFADFVLDTDRRELRRSPQLVAIAPQVFDLTRWRSNVSLVLRTALTFHAGPCGVRALGPGVLYSESSNC